MSVIGGCSLRTGSAGRCIHRSGSTPACAGVSPVARIDVDGRMQRALSSDAAKPLRMARPIRQLLPIRPDKQAKPSPAFASGLRH